jgi:glycosyltransferase involved in cell wall biosynthesis
MMAAKPIVCFEAAAKGVRHLEEVFTVPNHDWQKLGEAIVTVLRDPVLANRLAANAHETVLNTFDWRVLARKIEAIYEQLLPAK